MIVLFHENVFLYLQIHRHTNKISQFWSICLWFSPKTNAKRNPIGYWTTKERIWYDSKSLIFPHLFLCLARAIYLSGHLPRSIFSREGDIASTQNLLISSKPIICKLLFHVILWNHVFFGKFETQNQLKISLLHYKNDVSL
jgi:hypothetical protein